MTASRNAAMLNSARQHTTGLSRPVGSGAEYHDEDPPAVRQAKTPEGCARRASSYGRKRPARCPHSGRKGRCVTRRRALGSGTAPALVGGLGVITARPATPDRALIALCCEAITTLDRDGDQLSNAAEGPLAADARDDAAWERADATAAEWEKVMSRICAISARTPEGLQAKARVLRSLLPRALSGALHAAADPEEALALSLAGDMLHGS